MRIAVLKVREKSNWKSCQTISKNLHSAYAKQSSTKKARIEIYPYFKKKMETNAESIFADLKKKGVDRIVLIDHFPYPGSLFDIFARAFQKLNYYPEIFVHVYGCLMHWFNELDHKNPFFAKCKVHFITASEAQRRLLGQFLSKSTQISVVNFPLDTSVFNVLKNKSQLRKELGFAEDDLLLIYSGRAHVQKNLPLLLRSISGLMKSEPKIKFLFAGDYDDSQINFLEYRFAYGTNKSLVQKALKDGGIEKQFVELGNLAQSDLAKVLRASDIFCSLSMYNDEDYGYAPLEALASGCAALITGWGGYREFETPNTAFVKVRREYLKKTESLFVSPTEVQIKLQELLQKLPSNDDEIFRFVDERFSISAIAKQLEELHGAANPAPVLFNRANFLDLKRCRAFPLHRYNYMNFYRSYYA